MMTMAVLTKALAVRCKGYLSRAKLLMVVKQRTEAVESKKAAALIWMRTVADIFPWIAGSLLQLVVDLRSLGYP